MKVNNPNYLNGLTVSAEQINAAVEGGGAGLTPEQTAAIEKIEGLKASASEIDNIVNGATLYTTPEQFGETYDDISIQAALDSMVNGGVFLLKAGKTYEIRNRVVIPYSNITIIMYGATISLKASGINMIATKGYIDSSTRLSNISIYGGIINASSYSGTGLENLRTIFHMVDRLTIRDVKLLSTSGKYMIALSDTTDTFVDNIYCNCASDGIHLMGENYNTTIENIKGVAGDDLVAVTTLDYSSYAFNEGNVDGLYIKNIIGANATRIILLGNTKYTIDNVTIKNIYQKGTGACVTIGDGGELANSPVLGNVQMDGIYSTNSSNGILLRHSNMGNISIINTNTGVYLSRETNGTVGINSLSVKNSTGIVSAESYVTKITSVSLDNINTSKIQLAGIISNAELHNVRLSTTSTSVLLYGTIDNLIFSNCSFIITYNGADQNIYCNGVVNKLTLNNCYMQNGGINGSLFYFGTTTAIIKNIVFNNTKAYTFKNILQGLYTGSETVSIKLLESSFSNFKRIVEEGASTSIYNVYFKNFIITDAINEQIRLYNSQTINLYGDTVNLNVSLLSSDCSTNINCYIPDISLDISKIKKTAKARAYNTNSALSCGAGYVVCNGTAWTNIATGLTY